MKVIFGVLLIALFVSAIVAKAEEKDVPAKVGDTVSSAGKPAEGLTNVGDKVKGPADGLGGIGSKNNPVFGFVSQGAKMAKQTADSLFEPLENM